MGYMRGCAEKQGDIECLERDTYVHARAVAQDRNLLPTKRRESVTPEGNRQLGSNFPNSKAPENS